MRTCLKGGSVIRKTMKTINKNIVKTATGGCEPSCEHFYNRELPLTTVNLCEKF